MKAATPARIDGIVAQEANIAVLFRRGPSKYTQLLTWDMASDEVVAGQWIKGRAYTRRCDVSPDGRYLVGSFTNYSSSNRKYSDYKLKDSWATSGWTAISRPPYFSAIALWFTGGAWNGGGIWRSNRELGINRFPHYWVEAKGPGRHIRVKDLNLGVGEDEPIYSMLLKKRGWINEQEIDVQVTNPDYKQYQLKLLDKGVLDLLNSPWDLDNYMEIMEKSIPNFKCVREGLWRRDFERGSFRRVDRHTSESWQILDAAGQVRKQFDIKSFGVQWLDLDSKGTVVFGDRGCLWRWPEFPHREPVLVADLNGHKFEPVAPPDWALEW